MSCAPYGKVRGGGEPAETGALPAEWSPECTEVVLVSRILVV